MDRKPQLRAGQVLRNKYRIDGVISTHGGFGDVYEAWDNEDHRRVAVKYAFQDLKIEQFKNEALILTRNATDLPFIPDVYAHWRSRDGKGYFIVMEYVEGDTLDNVNPLPWSVQEVDHFLKRLLENLHDLHSRNPPIIHCDIKPDNIKKTLKKSLSVSIPYKILDFGIARWGNAEPLQAWTPPYAAPEQYPELPLEIDTRTDLYSLAATAYYLLTGQKPPDAEERYNQVVRRDNVDPLQSPSSILRGRTIPLVLEQTLIAMLTPDPNGRPRSAEEALYRLEQRTSSQVMPPPKKGIGPISPPLNPQASHTPVAQRVGSPTERPIASQEALQAVPPEALEVARLEHDSSKSQAAPEVVSMEPPAVHPEPSDVASQEAPKVTSPEPSEGAPPAPYNEALQEAPETEAWDRPQMAEPMQPNGDMARLLLAPSAILAPSVDVSATATELSCTTHGSVTSIAWSPNNQYLLIGSSLGVFRYDVHSSEHELWHGTPASVRYVGYADEHGAILVAVGDKVYVLPPVRNGTPTPVTSLAQDVAHLMVAPQSLRLAIVTDDAAHIYDIESGQVLYNHPLPVQLIGRHAALAANGQTLVVSNTDRITCWALDRERSRYQWHADVSDAPVVALAITPDGEVIAAASTTKLLIRYANGKAHELLVEDDAPIVSIALSSNGRTIAVANTSGVTLRRTSDGKVLPLTDRHVPDIINLAFSPDEEDEWLAAATTRGVWLWRLDDDIRQQIAGNYEAGFDCLEPLSDGRTLVTVGNTLHTWDLDGDTIRPGTVIDTVVSRPRALAVASIDDTIAVGVDGQIRLWRTGDGEERQHWPVQVVQSQGLAIGEAQVIAITASGIERYDRVTGAAIGAVVLAQDGQVEHVALAANGSRAVVHTGGRIVVYDLATGTDLYDIDSPTGEVTALAFTASGSHVAVASNKEIVLCRLGRSRVREVGRTTIGDFGNVHRLVIASDGGILASAHDAKVHLWRLSDSRLSHHCVVQGHTDRVTDMVLLPERIRLVTASWDGTLRLWSIPE